MTGSPLRPDEIDVLSGLLARLTGASEQAMPEPRKRKRRSASSDAKYLSEAEIADFFKAVAAGRSVRDMAIFRVVYHRGLRAAEVRLLQLSHYQPDTKRLFVQRLKGSHSGIFRITRHEEMALKAWLKVRGTAPGPLFPSRQKRGLGPQQLDNLMKRYCAAAGIAREKAHMHALKHSCGTHLLARGESIEDVQDHLGHVNIQNTLIYAKITNRRREARDARLADW
jgi:site-specific recombinase XerD